MSGVGGRERESDKRIMKKSTKRIKEKRRRGEKFLERKPTQTKNRSSRGEKKGGQKHAEESLTKPGSSTPHPHACTLIRSFTRSRPLSLCGAAARFNGHSWDSWRSPFFSPCRCTAVCWESPRPSGLLHSSSFFSTGSRPGTE